MLRILTSALLLSAAPAWANFAECVLDKMPGAANDVAASAILQVCQADHPGGLNTVDQGSGRGWFGFKSGPECAAAKAKDTRSQRGASMIFAACRRLYDEPVKLTPFTGKLDGER